MNADPQFAMLGYGFPMGLINPPEDATASDSSLELSDKADYISSMDDEMFHQMEQALQEQRAFTHFASTTAMPMPAPYLSGYAYGLSDTDSSSSHEAMQDMHDPLADWMGATAHMYPETGRFKRAQEAYYIDHIPAPQAFAAPPPPKVRKVSMPKNTAGATVAPKRRARTRTAPKRSRYAAGLMHSTDGGEAAGGQASPRENTDRTSSMIRVAFERLVENAPTALLMAIEQEMKGLREGSVRHYYAEGSRAPDNARQDEDGKRRFTYKKANPHQHKTEKSGDAQARCFACALRVMHFRSEALVASRSDSPSLDEVNSADNIRAAKEIIRMALGLPENTTLFDYELVLVGTA